MQNGIALYYASNNLKNDKFILECIKQDGIYLKYKSFDIF